MYGPAHQKLSKLRQQSPLSAEKKNFKKPAIDLVDDFIFAVLVN